MDIVMVDDSVPFDGTTPLNQPLGGSEKAIVDLAAALARRGHRVRVFNRSAAPVDFAGVNWQSIDGARAASCDLLIASRKPALLDAVPAARYRVLWVTGSADYLATAEATAALTRHADARLAFVGATHRESWRGDEARSVVIRPGVARCFLDAPMDAPVHPPRAVVTTHPLMDLDWLLELWVDRIEPRAAGAELVIYSAALIRAAAEGSPSAALADVFARAAAGRAQGVRLARPLADPDMADAYVAARVHLYPGHSKEVYAATLAESQAAGLPAVARKRGAAPERLRDGRTGFLVSDDQAFVNCAVLLLNDDSVFWARRRDCRSLQRSRTWDEAAAEFEALAT